MIHSISPPLVEQDHGTGCDVFGDVERFGDFPRLDRVAQVGALAAVGVQVSGWDEAADGLVVGPPFLPGDHGRP
jgi:hypothetical protein